MHTRFTWVRKDHLITHQCHVGGGWGLPKVVATFNYVGGSCNLFMATTGGVWIIPSFRIWCCMLSTFHVASRFVASISGPSLLFFLIALEALLEEIIARKLLSLSLDLFFKILLFQVTFLIFFSRAVFSPYFLLVGLLLQYVAVLFSVQGTS